MLSSIPFMFTGAGSATVTPPVINYRGRGSTPNIRNSVSRKTVTMQSGYGFRITQDRATPGAYPVIAIIKDMQGKEQSVLITDSSWNYVAQGYRAIDVQRGNAESGDESWFLTIGTDPADYIDPSEDNLIRTPPLVHRFQTNQPVGMTGDNNPINLAIAQSSCFDASLVDNFKLYAQCDDGLTPASTFAFSGGKIRLWWCPDNGDEFFWALTPWELDLTTAIYDDAASVDEIISCRTGYYYPEAFNVTSGNVLATNVKITMFGTYK